VGVKGRGLSVVRNIWGHIEGVGCLGLLLLAEPALGIVYLLLVDLNVDVVSVLEEPEILALRLQFAERLLNAGPIPALGTLGLLWNCAEQVVGPGRDPPLPGTRHLHPLLDGLPGHQSTEALSPGNGMGISD